MLLLVLIIALCWLIVPWLWGWPPDDRRYYPLYAECIELDVPFCTQVGHTGPLRTSETGRPIPYLENVLLDFPELRVVAGHVGAPWMQEMLSLVRKFPNLVIDTSAYKPSRFPPELADYLRGRGRTRVLFGTNYPMLTAGACLQGLGELGLDEESERLFLADNARLAACVAGALAAHARPATRACLPPQRGKAS